jgi:hypothetical protein
MNSGLEYIVTLTAAECWVFVDGIGPIIYAAPPGVLYYMNAWLPLRTVPIANVRQRLEPRYVVTLWT